MEILLVRHAQSEENTGAKLPHLDGEHRIQLSEKGIIQARELSAKISPETLTSSLIYCSPFYRARQTMQILLATHGLDDIDVREDPLLREQNRGYQSDRSQAALRRTHGIFWYRHVGGESPADCHQRISIFLSDMHRHLQTEQKRRVVIVGHGMMIRCFVMRFLRLGISDFDQMKNPDNGSVVPIGKPEVINLPAFVTKSWAVGGIRLRGKQC